VSKSFLTGVLIFVIFVSIAYFVTLVAEPFDPKAVIIKHNFEKLFYAIANILPWLLLFIFGDTAKIKMLLKSNNGN
jgi:hypothetical protein